MSSVAVENLAAKMRTAPKLTSVSFIEKAKAIVLDNFNAHRKPDRVPELTPDQVNVVWFAKAMGGFNCTIDSSIAKGLLWKVTYASNRDEIYLDVFTKLNNLKIDLKIPEIRAIA